LKLVFVADFFVEDGLLGGGELNNKEFIELVSPKVSEIKRVKSQFVDDKFIRKHKNHIFIVSNFVLLPHGSLDLIRNNVGYAIYEHDHKYLRTRNPAFFENFKAPRDQIVNYEFYKNAVAVFCQSSFHSDIVRLNLDLDNIINLSGNLWSMDSIENLEMISKLEKEDKCSILDSEISHKNTLEAVLYCRHKKYQYDLVKSNSYHEFLRKLGKNERLVFFPKTPETLSRIVVEARMMGMSIITNNLVGATKEPWFEKKGEDLVQVIKNKREEIPNQVLGCFR